MPENGEDIVHASVTEIIPLDVTLVLSLQLRSAVWYNLTGRELRLTGHWTNWPVTMTVVT